MNISEFLQEKLEKSSSYNLTNEDRKLLDQNGIKVFIKTKLLSKKFRKWSIDSDIENRVNKAIEIAIGSDLPLQIIYPQGGYKLWRFSESFPEPDWAEFFNIAYLIEYLAPIAKAYNQGIQLFYYIHTLIPELHDNLKKEDIDIYLKSFQELLNTFSKFLPNNFSISITKDIDFYTREEYFETIESSLVKAKQDFENSPENIKQSLLKSSELNIKWDGNIDMTTYSPSEKADRILKGAYYEKALSYLEAPKVFTKSDDKILLFIKSSSGFIGIGSNKTSMTKHWIGTGIIENRESKLIDRILSPRQFEEIKPELKFENTNLINMKNFKKIGIYNGTLDFTKK